MYKCYVGGCWWVVVIWRFERTASRWRADVEWAERDVTRQRKAARSGGIWKGQEKGQHLLLQPVDKLLQPVDLCHPLAVFVINSWPRHTDQGFDVKIVYNTGIKKGWGKHTYHKTHCRARPLKRIFVNKRLLANFVCQELHRQRPSDVEGFLSVAERKRQ